MESMEVLETSRVSDGSVASCDNGFMQQHSSSVKGCENPEDNLLEDLDSYLEDIDDRLTISRMVSDSVIKGLVTAVEQEASSKIAVKELEVARLKEALRFYDVGADQTKSSSSQFRCRFYPSGSGLDPLVEHYTMTESLSNLTVAAKSQFERLKKEIDNVRDCTSLKTTGSGSKLMGSGGIPQDRVSGGWVDVDNALHSLKSSLDNMCRQVDDLYKAPLSEWQQERAFQEEIEDMVISNCIRSLHEEFEERLWSQNARFCDSESVKLLERIKEISNLRQDLNTIYMSLSTPENGQLTSRGSTEIGEEGNNSKKTDLFDRLKGKHGSESEGNGKHESESMSKTLDNSLKHMSKEDLAMHFKTEMTKMKRNHESEVQEMTEEYFRLKREGYKERGFLPVKKDKEFEILRKKIPEVISKLDDILVENEKLPASSNNAKSIGSLKDGFSAVLLENRQLKDFLTDKKKEVKALSLQVSDAAEKISKHSSIETKLLRTVEDLEGVIEDAHIGSLIGEEVCKCVLKEVLGRIKCNCSESHMESAQNAEASSRYEIQDSDIESIYMQGLLGIISREAIKDAKAKLSTLHAEYMNEKRIQMKLMEKEKASTLEVKQEIQLLRAESVKKEKLALEVMAGLAKEKERLELANQEIIRLKDHTNQQQTLISESRKALDALERKLLETTEQIYLYKVENRKLNQKLETAMKELMETNEERRMLLTANQDMQNTLSPFEAKERAHRKQMESMIIHIHGLAKAVAEFECTVEEDIKNKSLRPGAFVMRVSDDEMEDTESDEEENHDQHLTNRNRFACDDLYLSGSDDSEDDTALEVQSRLMDKVGLVEGALCELTNEQQLGVKEEIRNQLSALEADLLGQCEKSTSVIVRIEKYRATRQEIDRRLDTQYQRKIAEALDDHLTAIQRDHELQSQMEERRIRNDAAFEEAKRKEKALQEEKMRQEKAKVEAEAMRKRVEEERIAALESERKAAEEAAQKEAINKRTASEGTAAARPQMDGNPGNSNAQVKELESNVTKKPQSATGNTLKVAESALILEQGRLQKLKELDEKNHALRMSSNQVFSSYERQINRWTRLITGTIDSVRAKADELIKILNDPRCPQSISIAAFAQKIVSQCDRPNKLAFACGYAIVLVTSQVPHAMDIILAEFHKACIYTVPKHISYSKSAFESKEAYYKTIGYQEDNGKRESHEDYLTRLESYMTLYAALVQTEIQGVQNAHGLKEGWAWLSMFLNALPANAYTGVALEAFLKIAGFALFRRYKSQFQKLLNIISNEFLNELKVGIDDPVVNKIVVEIKTYIDLKMFLQEPEGRRLQGSLLSSAMAPESEYREQPYYPQSNRYIRPR